MSSTLDEVFNVLKKKKIRSTWIFLKSETRIHSIEKFDPCNDAFLQEL